MLSANIAVVTGFLGGLRGVREKWRGSLQLCDRVLKPLLIIFGKWRNEFWRATEERICQEFSSLTAESDTFFAHSDSIRDLSTGKKRNLRNEALIILPQSVCVCVCVCVCMHMWSPQSIIYSPPMYVPVIDLTDAQSQMHNSGAFLQEGRASISQYSRYAEEGWVIWLFTVPKGECLAVKEESSGICRQGEHFAILRDLPPVGVFFLLQTDLGASDHLSQMKFFSYYWSSSLMEKTVPFLCKLLVLRSKAVCTLCT